MFHPRIIACKNKIDKKMNIILLEVILKSNFKIYLFLIWMLHLINFESFHKSLHEIVELFHLTKKVT